MSEMDGLYGQSSLATLNIAYNNNRITPVQPLNAPRRQARTSYKPAMGPPPAGALPAPPSNMQQYTQQHMQPLRLHTTPSNIASHPYSAHSFASTPEFGSDLEDGFSSANERQQRHPYRPAAHTSGPLSSSQAQGLNLNSRQPSTSSLNSHGDPQFQYASPATRERTGAVSPGSYFAAYPPAITPPARDRADSGASGRSIGSSSHTASASGTPPTPGPPSTPPAQAHSATHSIPNASLPPNPPPSHPPNHQPQASVSHKKPSSRRALTAALELAKSAVQLDATSDDPHGAVLAYAKSVQLLSEVMERVMRGEDPPSASASTTSSSASSSSTVVGGTLSESEDRRRIGRRRSVVAKEEEVRRLKAIHDTYADRMKILCLIYSIPDPLPSNPHTPSAQSTAPLHLADRHATAASSTGGQLPSVGPMASTAESIAETLPDAPEDVYPEELPARDADAATIRKAHQPNGTNVDWEVDSEWQRTGLSRDRPRNRERDHEVSNAGYHQSLQQSPVSDDSPSSATLMPRSMYTMGPPRSLSQDAVAPITTSMPVSLSGLRSSVIPPPRPPPSGPLPNRPRMPSGVSIPPQLLNQPLPPLPPAPKPQTFPEPSTNQTPQYQQTITRQSSSSSVSATSGVSSTASGSSAASNLLGQNANVNLLPNALPTSTSLSTAALSTGSGSTVTGRSRSNSNAHGRNPSNADRLVAVNEEREEEENGSRAVASSTTPPQEYKYRSRGSSMVSLKDRDRAKAQVLGSNAPLPPIPPTPVPTSSPSATPTTASAAVPVTPRRAPADFLFSEPPQIPAPFPSPGIAVFGSKATPRQRGSSVGSSTTHLSDDYINSGGSPSTTPIAGSIPYTAGGVPPPSSAPIIIPGSLGSSDSEAIKINPNTSSGTISQRRQKNSFTSSTPGPGNTPLPPLPTSVTSGPNKLTSAVLSASTATSLGLTSRNRAASNPGKWPASMVHMSMGEPTARPPMPPPPMSAGPRRQFPFSTPARYQPFGIGIPSPSASANASSSSLAPGAPTAGFPSSSPPPAPPALSVLRPYHLMSLLRKSMTERTGGYITPRLHVPHEVWTQGSARLTNSAEKTKVVDVLVAALDELSSASVEFCGSASGIAGSTGGANGDRKQAEKWAIKLEEFDRSFRAVGETFGKKLGVGGGFVVKKHVGMSAWSSKVFDKITTVGKPYDSPMAYASLLARFFAQVQLLDEHTRALHISPQPRSYASLPQDVRTRIEGSLKSISELFAKVVLTFVFRDLSLMLDKYHKTCDRWIQSNPGTQS